MNVAMMTFVKAFAFLLITIFYAPFVLAQQWVGTDYIVLSGDEVIELSFSEAVAAPKLFVLETGEPRLVLDWVKMSTALPGQDIGQGQKAIKGQGPVERIRFAPRGEAGLRLVMELQSGFKFAGTQNLGERLQVKFSKTHAETTVAARATRSFDPFRYRVPIPRPKPSLNIQAQQITADINPSPAEVIQVNLPHDPFLYAVPFPRLKPSLNVNVAVVELVEQVAKLAAFDIYAPKKRNFLKTETPYPRTAPHLGDFKVATAIKSTPRRRPQEQRKTVIVIDPGHGGYDPGAIGAKGTKEKHITSAVTQRLAASLRATGRYQVVLTRTKDVYGTPLKTERRRAHRFIPLLTARKTAPRRLRIRKTGLWM